MELVIFIGLPASGKSTFYQSRMAASHLHVSKDQFRNAKNRDRRQENLIRAAFQNGRSVVVDNTNPGVADRKSLIQLGHSFGAQVIGYYFESIVNDCLLRNKVRTGKMQVPAVAIYATIKKLEPPSYSEGFDQLYFVRIVNNREFIIDNWTMTE